MKSPPYLQPYLEAARLHGPGFKALLWASPQTQAARFDALWRICDFRGLSILDAGCGQADFLDFLHAHGWSGQYIGVEAIEDFAAVARSKSAPDARIILGDFIRQPSLLDQQADVIVFCGSLNTLDRFAFHVALRAAAGYARRAVAFNFLSSPQLAAADHLTWHPIQDVLRYANQIGRDATYLADYMDGDCTMLIPELRNSPI